MSDKIKLGIIGLHNHYHIYPMADYLAKGLPGLALVSVYDERTTLAREFAGNYQVPEVHDSRESLLERSDIDAVIITRTREADYRRGIARENHQCSRGDRPRRDPGNRVPGLYGRLDGRSDPWRRRRTY